MTATATQAATCPRCEAEAMTSSYDEPHCMICSWTDYAAGADYNRRRRETAALIDQRGFSISYVGPRANLSRHTASVEPRKGGGYRIRCPYCREGTRSTTTKAARVAAESRDNGSYKCHQNHIIYVRRDEGATPVSWS